jgi:predicted dienelactone hydrolase
MKYTTLAAEKLTVPRLLAAAARDKAVFLTVADNVRFVLLPADEGDQEVCALRNNAEFMAYLEGCIERGKTGKTYTLEQVKAELGMNKKPRNPANSQRRRPPRTRAAKRGLSGY